MRFKQLEAQNIKDEAVQIKEYILPNLHEALENVQREGATTISGENVAFIVSRWTGIPVHRLGRADRERLSGLSTRLGNAVFGQKEAVEHVSSALLTSRAGFSEQNRPIAVFLFLGPTGVGKTELAKAVAFEMFDRRQFVTIDCSDYQSEISITKLVGVSAGYVGYNEGGRLTEPVRTKPFNLILFDEFDLAHKSFYGILYQLFDEGRIVDGRGVEVDFKNTIIIMTSNLGYRGNEIEKINFEKNVDFVPEKHEISFANKLLIDKIGPALFNRIDSVIHFNKLSPEVMASILEMQLENIKDRFKEKNVFFTLSHNAKSKILSESCDTEFGARPLKKYLQREIVTLVAKYVVESGKSNINLHVDVDNDQFTIHKQ